MLATLGAGPLQRGRPRSHEGGEDTHLPASCSLLQGAPKLQEGHLSFQVELEHPDPTLASTSAVRAASQRPELYAGGHYLLDLRRLHTLFPCAQGILEGSLAQAESLWLEYPHHVSAMPLPCLEAWLPNRGSRCLQEEKDKRRIQPKSSA